MVWAAVTVSVCLNSRCGFLIHTAVRGKGQRSRERTTRWRPKAACSVTHRLQQSSRRRLLLSGSGARPRRSQQQLMPLPLDWNQWQLWTLTLLLFYHGGSRSPQRRHGPRRHPRSPDDWLRLSPSPRTSGLEKPIGFQCSPAPPGCSPVIGHLFLMARG